jgi:hypothetical protein
MGRVVSGSGRVMSGCRVRFGRVSGFSYNFRVASGYFLNSGENFGPRLTRRMIGSGRFFFGWVGSGLSSWATHDQVYLEPTCWKLVLLPSSRVMHVQLAKRNLSASLHGPFIPTQAFTGEVRYSSRSQRRRR